jgi:hypothetical protein
MKLLLASVITFCLGQDALGQALIGTWQLSEEKTCFQSQMKESDTELELKDGMGASRHSVTKIITFSKKGSYEEGIYSQGKKKGSNVTKYNYQVSGQEIQLMDKKSGMATQRYVIDELTATTLHVHNAIKDCEVRTFIRIE